MSYDAAPLAFEHRQSAHCETGVVSSLLTHHGLPISEPMAFGISASMAFAYIPLVKVAGMPLIAYRMRPGSVMRGVSERLKIKWHKQRFKDEAEGMAALDAALADGKVVGLQTSVYWLPYFPENMRFHFNAHNLIVYGRDGDEYLISDPLFEEPVRCPRADLQKARFAKGALASKGLMYYPTDIPADIDFECAIKSGISRNYKYMTKAPLPVIGVRGMKYMARQIVKLSKSDKAEKYLPLYLGHIVRMQEEIGTGGAGFRFIYAAFLQEASELIGRPDWAEASDQLTDAGDEWRRFALMATKMCRGRSPMNAEKLRDQLYKISDMELTLWRPLKANL